jgi:hypothetical protein
MQSRVKLLSSTALAAAAIVMAVPTASAQDIGALEKRVKALEKSGGGQNVSRSKKTMKLVVSGHLNRLVQWRDNGTKTGIIHATSQMSRSRVRWIGTGKLTDDLTVGTYIELGNSSSISSGQDLDENSDIGGSTTALDERFLDLSITSKTLGKLYIGQGSAASDGTSERDLSGTGLLSLNGGGENLAGSEQFQFSALRGDGGVNQGTGTTIGNAFNNFDGLGRRDRIRYDTPKFAGFQVSASHGNGDAWDVALRYGGSIGDVKVTGAISYFEAQRNTNTDTINGSLSVLLPMGLSFTIAGADQSDSDGGAADSAEWRYAKIGYKFKALELGQTRLYVDYSENDDQVAVGTEASYVSFGVVQILEPLGMELQIGYHNFDLDLASGVGTEDIDVFTMGLRAKF